MATLTVTIECPDCGRIHTYRITTWNGITRKIVRLDTDCDINGPRKT